MKYKYTRAWFICTHLVIDFLHERSHVLHTASSICWLQVNYPVHKPALCRLIMPEQLSWKPLRLSDFRIYTAINIGLCLGYDAVFIVLLQI